MSEAVEAGVAQAISAGAMLRRARESAGMHVAALAVSLKVPVRKLEALEQDRFEEMGDAVFIRALASSVCRALKVDPQPVLECLPQTAVPRLVENNEGLNAPFHVPGDGAPPGWREALIQPVPLAVIGLLLAAAAIYLLPNLPYKDEAVAVAVAPVQPPPVSAALATQEHATPAAPVASEPVALPAVAAAMPAAVASASEANAAGPAEPVSAPQQAASVSAAAPANGIVTFRTKGESWVEVVDVKGAVALRKLMGSGETAGATGALPLTVTIGKVDMTEVRVRGKPFDLKSVSRDNVARFDVK